MRQALAIHFLEIISLILLIREDQELFVFAALPGAGAFVMEHLFCISFFTRTYYVDLHPIAR